MTDPIPFQPTRSYIYNASRYELLPKIEEIARTRFGSEPFLLRDITKELIAATYTPEQLDIKIQKAESKKMEKVSTIFGFFVPYLAEKLEIFERLGDGMWRNISIDEEMVEAEAAEAEASDGSINEAGAIYAYSFPSIVKGSGNYPIKIGKTSLDDAQARIVQQCRQTCCFEYPTILNVWAVERVSNVEVAIHAILKSRGVKRRSPGQEWFDTSPEEIKAIVKFIQPKANTLPLIGI